MSFVLRPNMPLAAELRRAVSDRLARAAAHLRPARHGPITDRDVHEARKMLKQARAVVRLLRPAIGGRAFRQDNTTLRDVARALSQARDRAVLEAMIGHFQQALTLSPPAAAALDRLRWDIADTGADVAGSQGDAIGMTGTGTGRAEPYSPLAPALPRGQAGRRRQPASPASLPGNFPARAPAGSAGQAPALIPAAATDISHAAIPARQGRLLAEVLDGMQRRIEAWHLADLGWRDLPGMFQRSYRRARKRFGSALAGGDDEALHESRKRLKDLWYQRRLLRRAWKPRRGLAPGRLEALTEWLGEDHDLAILQQRAREALPGEPAEQHEGRGELLRVIAAQRSRLKDRIARKGEKLLRKRPRAIRRKLKAAITRQVPSRQR